MLLPIKAICKRKGARRDGTSNIYIQYCYSPTHRTLLNTGIAIPPRYWNNRKRCVADTLPTTCGEADVLNAELVRMVHIVENLVIHAQSSYVENIGDYVKATFKPDLEDFPTTPVPALLPKTRSKTPELFATIDTYIQIKQRKVCPKAVATFKSMREHLRAYEQHTRQKLSFRSFDYTFYESFIDFLAFDYKIPRKIVPEYGLKTNTIGKTIKQLRIFIKDCIKRKLISPIDISDFTIPTEETDAIYLTHSEIQKIYTADLSTTPNLGIYRDLFVLACLTGLRFSDFTTLKPEDVRNNLLYKKQNKSDGWVVIPLREETKNLLTKLFKEPLSKLSNPVFNRYIKVIGKYAGIDDMVTFSHKRKGKDMIITKPKYDWITSHTARRTFCTNEFLAGTPVKLIMQISGHKSEKNFYSYIRISQEEAALQVQKLWLERNNMLSK